MHNGWIRYWRNRTRKANLRSFICALELSLNLFSRYVFQFWRGSWSVSPQVFF
ncbi:hypothetical protein NC651_022405 [Populus alba x Populus x berolinensis]|nr:hypothetical protein NC651_022405 [Populus alba x Populus x berolinensis]